MNGEPSHDALISQSFDMQTECIGIAKKMTDLVISGEHQPNSLLTLSSYLAGIAAKNKVLKEVILFSEPSATGQRRAL